MLLTNKFWALVPFIISLLALTHGQENIQHQIPPSLVECYNTTFFQNRDNRLPYNLETFLTLIEKIENSPNYQYDIRQLSVALLHRFRQDGIERAPNIQQYPGVIPYAPTGFQFPKFRILLSRLIPGNAFNFPNNSLSREERCSMHFMLSSSFDLSVRGNENQVCNQLSTFRRTRFRRAVDGRNNFMGDVEILEEYKQRSGQKQGSVRMANGNDWSWLNMGQQSINTQISQCPVENGVIRTPWGTVAIGNVIAGIAAGLQQQTVQLRTLLALSSRPGSYNAQQVATFNIDNRYAATLAGDLAETTLIQVPTSNTGNASVGATGGWNSTVMPKWYFLTQNTNLEMTDAEIRGDTDGLILSLNIASWYSQNPSLKLSQLLRMYYSTNGVLNSGIMACQRQSNFQTLINQNTLISQTAGFGQVLDREMTLRVTLTPTIIAQFAAVSTQALANYVLIMDGETTTSSTPYPPYQPGLPFPPYSPGLTRYQPSPPFQYVPSTIPSTSFANQRNDTNETIIHTDVFVYMDTSWTYTFISEYINFILQRLNINPYTSSVTLICAQNGAIMVNTTNYITSVYEQWNITTHNQFPWGFRLPIIYNSVRDLMNEVLRRDLLAMNLGGRSAVAILVPSFDAYVAERDYVYSRDFLNDLNTTLPDLNFLFYSGGAVIRWSDFVSNPRTDLFAVDWGDIISDSAYPVVKRIKTIPRRLYNPGCYYPASKGLQMLQTQYVGGVNFYRMLPQYFFMTNTPSFLKISASSPISFTVCTSRMPIPYGQRPQTGCQSITLAPIIIDIKSLCPYSYLSADCTALYISVHSQDFAQPDQVTCNYPSCQTTYMPQYTIEIDNQCNACSKLGRLGWFTICVFLSLLFLA